MSRYDLIIVGAGIVGLAHALAATRRGLRTLVIDRDTQANGASVRNFGFVTVTGQRRGRVWSLARRSAAIWRDIAPEAGIAIEQQGLLLAARRQEALDVIEAFAATEIGENCRLLSAADARAHCAPLSQDVKGALLSSDDLRVESRTAIPLLAQWLAQARGVSFRRGANVSRVEPGLVLLADGDVLSAAQIIACPNDDGASLFPGTYAADGIIRCQLQMLRLASPGWRLPNPVMSDLSLVRYLGYSELREAEALMRRLSHEAADALDCGIHLIVVQSADGSLVVGDSHAYAPTPEPFLSNAVEELILRQFEDVLGHAPPVLERWAGVHASGPEHSIVRSPAPDVHLVVVTSGTGASTAFALAEDVMSQIYD